MRATTFNKKVEKICIKYGGKHKLGSYVIDTPFGELQILSSPTPRIKHYTIFMRFTKEFFIGEFFRYFSPDEVINKHSKKWNIHVPNPEYAFKVLEERLEKLSKIEDKIEVIEPKSVL